jgi:hypothetical protein
MRVALRVTAVNDAMYPETGKAVRLLPRLGVDVEFPSAQTCCALAHAQPAISSSNGWRVSTAQGSCTRSSSTGRVMKAARSRPDVWSAPRRKVGLTGLHPVWPISVNSRLSASAGAAAGGGATRAFPLVGARP